jgi:hypothetical protein
MSTKTTFKRIALVTVAALGFGVLTSVAPANAAAKALVMDYSSVTVVGTYADTNPATKGLASYHITVMDNSTTSVAADLANGETITASVLTLPAVQGGLTPAVGDLAFLNVTNNNSLTHEAGQNGASVGTLTYGSTNCTYAIAEGDTTTDGSYCLGVYPTKDLSLYGTYEIAIDLLDVNRNVLSRQIVKYRFASAANSGAVVTVASAGTIVAGETYVITADKYMSATIADANGGRVFLNDSGTTGALGGSRRPALSATLESSTGTVLNTLTASDSGTVGDFKDADGEETAWDGVYGLVPSAAVSSSVSTTAASTIRVRFGLVNATLTKTALPTATGTASQTLRSVTGTGIYAGTAGETTTASGAITYEVPLSTTSVTVSFVLKNSGGTALQNEPITIYTTWAGTNAGSVTPVSGITYATTSRSNASGVVTYTVTQANPVEGSSAVITPSGALNGTYGAITLEWAAPAVTSGTVDAASFKSVAASATKFGITVKDQFNNPMAGIVLQPSLASTNANYSATAMATLTTNASGYASVTLTGGAASTTVVDAVTFKYVGTTLGTSTATYVAALPVVATLTGAWGEQNATEYPNVFATTAIGAAAALAIDKTLDYTKSISVSGSSADDTQVKMQVTAKDAAGAVVTGVPVTVTTSAGAWITDSCTGAAGKPVQSKVCYPTSTGLVTVNAIATGTGTQTVTFTAGAISASQTLNVKNVTADARSIALSASGADVTATVTDRFGNGVSGISVLMSTSVGTLGNGQKTSTYTTDTNGKIAIVIDADGATTVTAYQSDANDSTSLAGYSSVYPIGTAFSAAGIRSATISATGTGSLAGISQAAVDAAAEATDAANAATDAANAAAEAADAATAAAQDAADAVAALSAQVSSMMSSLKAQLTALTNLVIKIQKKVKA